VPSSQRRKSGESKIKPRGRATSTGPNCTEWGFLTTWEFQVRPSAEKHFRKLYGPDGGWARLFSQDESYMGTELIRDLKGIRTYLTLDFWTSEEAYDAFRKRHHAKYEALDRKYEEMTDGEREIGRFVRVPSK
jgi:heme-degrading monooxygenase HmoA